MKRIYFIAYAITLLLCVSCKTQEIFSCEDVTQTSEIPWLSAIIEKGPTWFGQKLLKIDKIVYSTNDSNTTHIGFNVFYEIICCDIPHEYIYDCDGNKITIYGGIDGCGGVCAIKVLSRINLYSAEE